MRTNMPLRPVVNQGAEGEESASGPSRSGANGAAPPRHWVGHNCRIPAGRRITTMSFVFRRTPGSLSDGASMERWTVSFARPVMETCWIVVPPVKCLSADRAFRCQLYLSGDQR